MDEVKAYMESELGFEWREINRLYFREKPKMYVSVEEAEFLYDQHTASTRKTLGEARREVIGGDEDVPEFSQDILSWNQMRLQASAIARNDLRAGQRQKLDQMISALERKGGENEQAS